MKAFGIGFLCAMTMAVIVLIALTPTGEEQAARAAAFRQQAAISARATETVQQALTKERLAAVPTIVAQEREEHATRERALTLGMIAVIIAVVVVLALLAAWVYSRIGIISRDKHTGQLPAVRHRGEVVNLNSVPGFRFGGRGIVERVTARIFGIGRKDDEPGAILGGFNSTQTLQAHMAGAVATTAASLMRPGAGERVPVRERLDFLKQPVNPGATPPAQVRITTDGDLARELARQTGFALPAPTYPLTPLSIERVERVPSANPAGLLPPPPLEIDE